MREYGSFLGLGHFWIGFTGVGGRLWLSEHQRQVKEQVAWLSDSTKTARVVAG